MGITPDAFNDDGDVDGIAIDPVPKTKKLYSQTLFTNGSATNMNVDGSGTPVDFDITVGGLTFYIIGFSVLLWDPGTMSVANFGSISSLANGVEIIQEVDSTEYTLATITNNAEMALFFPEQKFTTSVNTGFLNAIDIFIGSVKFPEPITISGPDSDSLIVRINDNLTGLTAFSMSALGWRVI